MSEPAGLTIGKVVLADGREVLGVLGEPWLCESRRDHGLRWLARGYAGVAPRAARRWCLKRPARLGPARRARLPRKMWGCPTSRSFVLAQENHPPATSFPSAIAGTSAPSARAGTNGARCMPVSRRAIESFKAFQGTLATGAPPVLAAFRAMDEMGALSYRVWYYASLQYDEDQRDNEINARRQQVQILFAPAAAGELLVQPRAAGDSARDDPRVDGRRTRARRLPLRHREPVPRAGARARRGRRAAAVVFGPFQQRAVRQLLGADDRGHEVPVDHADDRRAGDADLRAVSGAARNQPAARTIAPPRIARFIRPTPTTRTPTRRSTTACCSATGFTPAPAATPARSTRRCTATTFRPRSSRT